jgi:hypothetical protein
MLVRFITPLPAGYRFHFWSAEQTRMFPWMAFPIPCQLPPMPAVDGFVCGAQLCLAKLLARFNASRGFSAGHAVSTDNSVTPEPTDNRISSRAFQQQLHGITRPSTAFDDRAALWAMLAAMNAMALPGQQQLFDCGYAHPRQRDASAGVMFTQPVGIGSWFCRSDFALPAERRLKFQAPADGVLPKQIRSCPPPLSLFICAQTGFCRSKFTLLGDNQLSRPSIAVKNGPP